LLALHLHAQQKEFGSIKGIVRSAEGKMPLSGANVLVQGTILGAAVSEDGEFVIPKVPVGTYSISVTMVGYRSKIVENVQVKRDATTTVVIELEEVALQTETVVVTASKREQSLQEVPISMSVLDAKMISQRNVITLDQALRYVPGVNIEKEQINIRGSSGYTRGVGSRVLLLVDGLPFLAGDTGEIIWEAIPTYQVDRVEVVKGAGSALYGSSALGGVINVITKDPRKVPETYVKLYGGLYGRPYYDEWDWSKEVRFFNGINLSHSQHIDKFSFLASISRTQDEGYRENDYYRRFNGFAKLKYDFSPFEGWTVMFNILNSHSGNYLFWRDIKHALQPPVVELGERVFTTRFNISSLFKQFISNRLFYMAKAIFYRSDWEDNIGHGGSDTVGNQSASNFLDGEVQMNYQPDDKHFLTGGVEGTYNYVSSNLFGKRSGFGVAVYGQDEWKGVDPLKITLGMRFDYRKIDSLDANSQLSPKFGIIYNPMSGTTLRASVGRGFRAPSVGEAFTSTSASGIVVQPNPGLQPEHSWSFEIGGTQYLSEHLVLDAVVFQNDFWDLIQPTFLPNGKATFQNVTRARIQGAEVNLKVNWFQKMVLADLSYTYIYPRDIYLDEILKYRSRHLFYASLYVNYGFAHAGLDFRYMSKIENIDMEFVTLGIIKDADQRGPVYVTDARVIFDISHFGLPLTIAFNVNNMFQYNYVELIGNLAPIRNYVLTVEGRL